MAKINALGKAKMYFGGKLIGLTDETAIKYSDENTRGYAPIYAPIYPFYARVLRWRFDEATLFALDQISQEECEK